MNENVKEPYKEMIDPLIHEIVKRKEAFDREYDHKHLFKDLRWQSVLEGHFFEQLYKFSSSATAEQIGEYVIEFFNRYDEDNFDSEEDKLL